MAKCNHCNDVANAFIEARKDPHHRWIDVYNLLKAKVDEGKFEVYASTCDFDNALHEIAYENHYCFYFYLRCIECGEIYLLGICVRGTPIFQTSEEFRENQVERTVDSGIGTYFKSK